LREPFFSRKDAKRKAEGAKKELAAKFGFARGK